MNFNLDKYIFCEECADFVYEYCSIHGPLLVIMDDKVAAGAPARVPRAALTVPRVFLHLAPSVIPGAGLGVFSTLTLPRGVRFGPYRGKRTHHRDSKYGWQLHDGNNKWSQLIDASDADASNWMRYVNCSRHWCEQNLLAYQYQGNIYYRTIKIIPRFTELMVFYGSEFANLLGIDLRHYNSPRLMQETCETYYNHFNIDTTLFHDTQIEENELKTIYQRKELEIYSIISNAQDVVKKKKANETGHYNNEISLTDCYICNNCSREFISKNELISHLKEHDNNELKINPILHMNAKTDDNMKPFSCLECNFKTTYKKNLKRHIKIHNKIPYNYNKITLRGITQMGEENNTINDSALGINNLEINVETYQNLKPFSCKECNFKTAYKESIKRHFKTHTKEHKNIALGDISDIIQMHEENNAEPIFNLSQENAHVLINEETDDIAKPFSCKECNFKSAYKRSLRRHILTHTKGYGNNNMKLGDVSDITQRHEENNTEPIYDLVKKNAYLQIYSETDVTIKPFSCEECNFKSAYKRCLNRHMKTHTKNHNNYNNIPVGNISEIKQMHGENNTKHIYDLAQENANVQRNAETDDRVKPFSCKDCNFKTAYKKSLKRHILIYHRTFTDNNVDLKDLSQMRKENNATSFECTICAKILHKASFKRHLKCHTDVKHFQCLHCDYRSKANSDLKRHLRKIHKDVK